MIRSGAPLIRSILSLPPTPDAAPPPTADAPDAAEGAGVAWTDNYHLFLELKGISKSLGYLTRSSSMLGMSVLEA
jgi:hypothetical protein